MAGPVLTRNAQALRFLLEIAPGAGHTLLAKLAYLADLLARQYIGRPITGMEYVWDSHGPFDAMRFYFARDELEMGQFITRSAADMGGHRGYPMHPTQRAVEYTLSGAEKEILTWVGQTYGSWTAYDICNRVVYETKPMKKAKRGGRIPMDEFSRSDDLEFDLERVLAGEKAAVEGRVRPLAEVLNELHARHHK